MNECDKCGTSIFICYECISKAQGRDKITISWDIDDVRSRAEEDEVNITDKQARVVLALVECKYDSEHGISWDTISCAIQTVLEDGCTS